MYLELGLEKNKDILARINDIGFVTSIPNPQATCELSEMWSSSLFNFDSNIHFLNLSSEQQKKIRTRLAEHTISEAFHIESLGMQYSAKMITAAQSDQELLFFSLMAKEEANHYRLLNLLTSSPKLKNRPSVFSAHISNIIKDSTRADVLLLIQVLLEGWGLHYYQQLAAHSTNINVHSAFNQILSDETRHHSAGVVLTGKYETCAKIDTLDHLIDLIEMIRCGPVMAVSAICEETKNFSYSFIESNFSNLDSITKTNENLRRVKNLLLKGHATKTVEYLEEKKFFKSYSISEMAQSLLKYRQ